MNIRPVVEPRRWAAFHCYGIYGQLMDIQASVEDLQGALQAGQLRVARYAGLTVIRQCLRLRSLQAAGFPPDNSDATADLFAGLPESIVSSALALSTRLAQATEPAEAQAAAEAIEAHVREFEAELGFPDSLPSVRRPEGLFPALRLAREVLPINRSANLPLALPAEWVSAAEPNKSAVSS